METQESTPIIEDSSDELTKLPYNQDLRTEQELKDGTILFQNEGVLDLSVNIAAFSQLLRDEGIDPNLINQVTIKFRAAELADRNVNSKLIGGITSVEPDREMIEVYTTIQINNEKMHWVVAPVRAEYITEYTLHELRHQIQKYKGDNPSDTFRSTEYEYANDPAEQDAIAYAQNNLTRAKDWIKTGRLFTDAPTFHADPHPDLNVDTKYFDLDNCIALTDPDSPALYWETKIDELINQEDDVELINHVVTKGSELVKQGKLGLWEFRLKLHSLADYYRQKGFIGVANSIEQDINDL